MKYILPDGTEISEEIFLDPLTLLQLEMQKHLDKEIIERMIVSINNKDQNEERI